jgi:DNA repair exonuclease SbcCD ATPase subunit
MSIIIKNITAKNFLSFGAVTQSVKFDQPLTLILGCNLDLGGDEANVKNGTGKSSLINALSYALYGQALANIRKENLINTVNGKAMYVTVEFEKSGVTYRIERGRKPNVLKFYINNQMQQDKTADDESQGDSRDTQRDIENVLGMSHTMFKHLIALNTYTEPFLSMRVADQREVIEQLLGVTILSEKSELLKIKIKEIKDQIAAEQFRIEAVKRSNETVETSIRSLESKSKAWESKKTQDIQQMTNSVNQLEQLDIEKEIDLHNTLTEWLSQNQLITELNRQRRSTERTITQYASQLDDVVRQIESLEKNTCPTCNQAIHAHDHASLTEKFQQQLQTIQMQIAALEPEILQIDSALQQLGTLGPKPTPFYQTLQQALEHKNTVDNLTQLLKSRTAEINPYQDQITELKQTAIQPICWDTANELSRLRDHHDFLLKLLTNKDSFIRKKIIDQNLTYLNSRLAYYLEKMGLPHSVVFQNDLSVCITQLGRDLDYHNLSRGEMNRVILSLSFAFRDVWEALYHSINVTFIDEIMDSGMDGAGVEAGLSLLKKMARERNKNIYLISHREELVSRVGNILTVTKQNGFTTLTNNQEEAETA